MNPKANLKKAFLIRANGDEKIKILILILIENQLKKFSSKQKKQTSESENESVMKSLEMEQLYMWRANV